MVFKPPQKFANNAVGHLDISLNDIETVIDLHNEGNLNWPPTPEWRIKVGDEIMNVTAIDMNDDPVWHLTVIRGEDGTDQVIHSADDVVSIILTRQSLEQFATRNFPNELAAAEWDQTHINTDILDDTVGNGLVYYVAHVDSGGTFEISWVKIPTGMVYIVPGFRFFGACDEASTAMFGMGLRESATGKLMFLGWHKALADGLPFKLRVLQFTDENDTTPTVVSETAILPTTGDLYVQAFFDETDVYFYLRAGSIGHPSNEPGAPAIVAWTEAIDAFFTTGPDEVIMGGYHFGVSTLGHFLAANMVNATIVT